MRSRRPRTLGHVLVLVVLCLSVLGASASAAECTPTTGTAYPPTPGTTCLEPECDEAGATEPCPETECDPATDADCGDDSSNKRDKTPDGSPIPALGIDAMTLGLIGLGALAIGGGAVLAARRRRDAEA